MKMCQQTKLQFLTLFINNLKATVRCAVHKKSLNHRYAAYKQSQNHS